MRYVMKVSIVSIFLKVSFKKTLCIVHHSNPCWSWWQAAIKNSRMGPDGSSPATMINQRLSLRLGHLCMGTSLHWRCCLWCALTQILCCLLRQLIAFILNIYCKNGVTLVLEIVMPAVVEAGSVLVWSPLLVNSSLVFQYYFFEKSSESKRQPQ